MTNAQDDQSQAEECQTDRAFEKACRNIRQFEAEPLQLSDEEISLLLARATLGSSRSIEIYRSAICGQAIINSSKARPLAEALLQKIFGLTFVGGTEAVLAPIAEMLDSALFDVYRDAGPLIFDGVPEYIDRVRDHVRRENAVPIALGDRAIYYAVHFGLTPLLNTEHQTQVAQLLGEILEIWDGRQWANVMPALRLDKLRQMILAPRLLLDGAAMDRLRSIAARQASRQAEACAESHSDDSASYLRYRRNLVLAMRYDEVRQKIRQDADLVSGGDDRRLEDFLAFLNFVQESSLSTELIGTAEDAFRAVLDPPRTFQFLSMCTRLGDVERGMAWIEKWKNEPANVARRFTEASFFNSIGAHDRALDMGSRVLSTFSSACRQDNFGQATSAILYRLTRETQTARFFQDIGAVRARASDRTADGASVSGVSVVLVPAHVNFTMQMPILAIEVARSQGAEISCLVSGMYPKDTTLHPATALLSESLVAPYFFRKARASYVISADWDIRPAERIARYKGVEYYPGLMNSLGIIFRRFTLDFEDPLVRMQVDRHLLMFQSAHDLFEEFEALAEPDREYRFAVVGIQYGIGYAIRRLIENSQLTNLRVLHLSNGFEGFDLEWRRDAQSGNPVSSYHSVRDLTGLPSTPLGFRPTPDEVEERVSAIRRQDGWTPNETARAYIEKVEDRYRAAAAYVAEAPDRGRTILMLGTVLPDLSIPEDSGFIHRDLLDWVEATVRIAERENIKILVKQHPAERDHKIGFYIAQRFADLIPPNSRNVTILPYETNFHSAVKSCDMVTMWAGTSAIELALLNKPFICCSRFANEEYPLGIPGPRSESDYEDMLLGNREFTCPPDAAFRAAAILDMTTSSPWRERSFAPLRQLLNAQVWPPRIDPTLQPDAATHRLSQQLIGPRAS